MAPPRFTLEQARALRVRHAEGKGRVLISDLARAHQVTWTQMYLLLTGQRYKQAGGPLYVPGLTTNLTHANVKLSDEQARRVWRLVHRRGWSIPGAARAVGCSYSIAWGIANRQRYVWATRPLWEKEAKPRSKKTPGLVVPRKNAPGLVVPRLIKLV